MALALENKSARRVNWAARMVIQKGFSPEQAVAAVRKWRKIKGHRRQTQGAGPGGRLTAAQKKAMVAGLKSGKPQSKARKAAYVKAKSAVKKLFGIESATDFSRYKHAPKRQAARIARRTAGGKAAKGARGAARTALRSYNAKRVAIRTRFPTISAADRGSLESIFGEDSGIVLAQHAARTTGGRKRLSPGKRPFPGKTWSGKSVLTRDWDPPRGRAQVRGRKPVAPKRGKRARANESALIPMGSLALTNPEDMQGWAMGLASGIAFGAVGLVAARVIAPKVSSYYAMVPVAGEYMAANPVATTAILLAAAPTIAGAYLGYTMDGKYSSMIAGALASAGTVAGAVWLSDLIADQLSAQMGLEVAPLAGLGYEDLSGIALENMGALALENESALGDGMAYQTAPLSAEGVDFGQASLADAAYSGADFSEQEGQALLNGAQHFLGCYGLPPHRMGGGVEGASHLAGRPGHRWGWLVKMVGFEKARTICALPPRERVKVIARLRAAALRAFEESSVAGLVQSADNIASAHSNGGDEVVSGTMTGGPQGASGPGDAYGASLFLGE